MGIYEMKKPKRINSFSVTLFLIVATVGYLGYFWLPVWWPAFQLTGIMKGICNDAYRQYDNDKLIEKLLKDSKRTKLYLTKESFTFTRVPYTEAEMVGLTNEQRGLLIKRGKKCVLDAQFVQRAEWPFTGKVATIPFDRHVEADLTTIKYDTGPSCGTIASP